MSALERRHPIACFTWRALRYTVVAVEQATPLAIARPQLLWRCPQLARDGFGTPRAGQPACGPALTNSRLAKLMALTQSLLVPEQTEDSRFVTSTANTGRATTT